MGVAGRIIDHVPMRAARTLAGALHLAGVDVRALYAGVGIDLAQLFDRSVSIPYARWCALWRRAEVESRDPLIGVRTSMGVDLSLFAGLVPENDHVVMHLVCASATVGESLERFAQYFAVGFGAAQLELVRAHGKLVAVYHPPSSDEPTPIADSVLGVIANYLRTLAEKPVHATIELGKRRAPAEGYRKLFGLPVALDAEHDAIAIPARNAALRLRSANPDIIARLVDRCHEELATRTLPGAFLDEVRMLVSAQIEQGGADSVAAIADAMKTSRRTLTRRLATEGTTYQALLDEVRTAIATRELAAGSSVQRIAERLGFADTSSFTRAFRRWTGHAPSAHPLTRRGTSRTP